MSFDNDFLRKYMICRLKMLRNRLDDSLGILPAAGRNAELKRYLDELIRELENWHETQKAA